MGKITDDMKTILASAKLSFVATVNQDGTPNLSPKATVAVYDDDHLIFADIASPGTMANLRHNPAVEINSVDVFRRRGYRFKGTARIVTEGADFDRAAEPLWQRHGKAYPVNHAVIIEVSEAKPVLSPAYMFGNAEETDVVREWSGIYELGLKDAAE